MLLTDLFLVVVVAALLPCYLSGVIVGSTKQFGAYTKVCWITIFVSSWVVLGSFHGYAVSYNQSLSSNIIVVIWYGGLAALLDGFYVGIHAQRRDALLTWHRATKFVHY
jgi:hypothetical protein